MAVKTPVVIKSFALIPDDFFIQLTSIELK